MNGLVHASATEKCKMTWPSSTLAAAGKWRLLKVNSSSSVKENEDTKYRLQQIVGYLSQKDKMFRIRVTIRCLFWDTSSLAHWTFCSSYEHGRKVWGRGKVNPAWMSKLKLKRGTNILFFVSNKHSQKIFHEFHNYNPTYIPLPTTEENTELLELLNGSNFTQHF